MKTKFTIVICILLIQFAAKAQMKIGDNPTTINSASLLELETTNKGLALPRVSITNISASSPLPAGLLTGTMVYNTNSSTTGGSGMGIYYWDGSKWNFIANTSTTSGSYWSLTGNSGLSASTNFIGTTDAIDFVVKTANTERMRILGVSSLTNQAGWIGMGTSAPRSSLDITGNYSNKNVLTLQNTSSTGFSSIDMLDNTGSLKGTFGYANSGTGGNFASRAYFNSYGSDLLFTANSGSYHLFLKGSSGFVGLNTNAPSERLHVVGNIYLNGAFMPGGNAGTSGYVLTSTGAGTSPTWTSPNNLSWSLTGNSGTSYATNFLGTTDFTSMRFRTNNIQRMIIDSLGRVGIGLPNPSYALSVSSQINPLYLSGVQATSTFSTDSVLTINGGVVKKAPYSSLTGNFWSLTGNSGIDSATNFVGTKDNASLRFRTNNIERMNIDSAGIVSIGNAGIPSFNSSNPPIFSVDYGTTASNTISYLRGSVDDYFQINLRNKSNGLYASTDYVATADNGTDSTYYIDMGINSSGYGTGADYFGGPNDAYLYAYSKNLLIGTQKASTDIIFLLNGGSVKNNTAMRITSPGGNIVIGKGEATNAPVGNTIRGPNASTSSPNTAGGSLTLQGGSATSTATGGSLNIAGGATSGTGTGGNVNISGGGTSGGFYGSVNINTADSTATNINTGSAKGSVKIGSGANNIFLPKYNAVGGLFYTSLATGQLANTGTKMTWDSINYRLGIGTPAPAGGLEITPNGTDNALILHNVSVGDPNYDSILSISSTGVVGYLDPSTILTFRYWGKNGNQVNKNQFLGTINNQALVFKFNNIQAGYLDDKNTLFGTSATVGAGNKNTAIGLSASAASSGTAIGASAVATGNSSVALGLSASATGDKNIAVGNSAVASGNNQQTAIGASALANNQNNTAVGFNASAITDKNATAIGANSSASGTNSMALGYNAQTSQDNAVVIGDDKTDNLYVGIGTNTPSAKLDINAKGNNNPLEMHGVPTGDISSDEVLTINSLGIVGSVSQSTVAGSYWSLNGNAATASSVLGTTNAQPLQFQYNKLAAGAIDKDNTSLGTSSNIGAGGSNTAIGNSSLAGSGATAIGTSSVASGKDNTALGNSASAGTSTQETVIGASATANAQNNTAIGYNASAITGQKATAIGAATSVTGTNSTVIGYNAKTTQANAVILGDATSAGLYVGIGTSTPSAKLDITATGAGNNPLELHGLPVGSYPTDNILSINSSGIVGYVSASTLNGNYIQNQTTQQASSNFNISGNGIIGTNLTVAGKSTLTGVANTGSFTSTAGDIGLNTNSNNTTNINSGTSTANVTIGNSNNNILFPKFNTTGGVFYTSAATGQIANTGSGMTWDNTNSRLGIGITNPLHKLSVLSASDPLYLSGVQATNSFSTDSVLTILNGVVKKAPYSSLPGGGSWSLTGNSGTTAGTNFLGTTDAQPLVIKSLNRQLAYFDGNLYSIALGYGAVNGSSDHNVAIGYNATTNNQYTLALGYNSTATGVRSVAIGNGASATIASGAEAVAIGYNAVSSAAQTIAIGYQATSSNSYGVAIGYGSQATGSQGTAIGYSSLASAQYANAIGYQAQATALQSTAIGYKAQTAQSNTILLGDVNTPTLYVGIGTATPTSKLDVVAQPGTGTNPLELHGVPSGNLSTDYLLTINNTTGVVNAVPSSTVNGTYWNLTGNAAASGNFLGTTNTTPLQFKFNSTAAGYLDANNTAFGTGYSFSGTQNTVIGYSANAANSSTAVGANSDASQASNTAIGNTAIANISSQATAIGASSQALYQYNTALGYNAQAIGSSQETVIGASSQAQGQYNVAVGYTAKANGSDKITVVGSAAQASFQNNTAIGYGALATTNNQATSVGASSQAGAQNATALGYNAKATGANSTALGYNAQTTTANTLILGDATNTSLNIGIGTATPGNKVEITDGVAGNSGLRFTNLTSSSTGATAANTFDQVLTVNASGDVVLTNGLSYVNTQAGAYTITTADNKSIVYITSASAVTITVPSTLPAGFTCAIIQGGAGQLTISGTGLQNAYSQFKTPNRYSSVTVQTPVAGTNVLSGQTSW